MSTIEIFPKQNSKNYEINNSHLTAEKASRRNVGPPPADEGGALADGGDSRQPR
jgi:hypothetical protein